MTQLEKALKSSLTSKEIKPVNPKENQPWIFNPGRTDAEAPILWPLDVKSQLTGKDPDAGRHRAGGEVGDRGWDGWMASLTQWTWVWANSRRQWRTGSLVCCSSWGHSWTQLSDWTTWPSNPTTGLTPWGHHNWKRHMYPNIHCSTIYNSWDMEAT